MRNWILVAIIMLVIGLMGFGGTLRSEGAFNFGGEEVEDKQTVDGQGVKNIDMKVDDFDLEVVKGSSNEITAELSGTASKKYIDKIKLKLERNGDTVTVTIDDKIGFSLGINILNVNLKVELPEQLYSSIVMDLGSGDARVAGLSADTIKLNVGSGDSQLEDLKVVNELAVESGSGDTHIMETSAGRVELKGNSGNLNLEKLKADELSVAVGSGDLRISDVEAALKARVGNGDVKVESDELKQSADIKTGNGDVAIHTDKRPESMRVIFTSGSGDLHNEWKEAAESTDNDGNRNVVFGRGETLLSVDTGSGGLSIRQR